MEVYYWILYYAVPAGIAFYLKTTQTSVRNRILLLHGFVLLSIILLSSTGQNLNWNFQPFQLLFVVIGVLITFYLLGLMGLLYFISSTIQQYCLLLAGGLIIPVTGLLIGAIVTSLPYTFLHFGIRIDLHRKLQKFTIIFLWGVFSVVLYFWLQQPLVNIAIHAGAGALLIKLGVLYNVKDDYAHPIR